MAISLVATAAGVAQTSITKVEQFVVTDGDTAADVAAFVYGGNTYVITDASGAAANDIIQLVGVTGAVSLSTTDAANSIFIA